MGLRQRYLEFLESLADRIEPFVQLFSTKGLREMCDVARRLSDAYNDLHTVARDELERRGELPPLPHSYSCPKCERSWDNARDLVQHACVTFRRATPIEHECDCESTAQVHSREECASQRDELAPCNGALEPGETTDGPARKDP